MNSPTPVRLSLYRQVVDHISKQIASGVYAPDQALPSEWALARTLKVSQGTVRKGLDLLVQDGLLVRQQGVGTFVTQQNSEWGRLALIANSNHTVQPRPEVLSISAVPAPEVIANGLNLGHARMVWKVLVLWRAGVQAAAVDEAYLHYDRLPELNIRHIGRRGGLYDLLQQHYGLRLQVTEQLLSWERLGSEQAFLLKAEPGLATALLLRRSSDHTGTLMEWRKRFILLNQYSLNLT